MRKLFARSALTSVLCILLASPAFAQTAAAASRPQTAQAPAVKPGLDDAIRTLFSGKSFFQAAISPDGKMVAWVESAGAGKSAIYVSAVNGNGRPRRITAGPASTFHSEDSVAWSPDSKRIAFLSDAAKAGQPQIYVSGSAGGPAKKITRVKGFLASPGWSPDGTRLAVLFTENAARSAGPLVAETPRTGLIQDAVVEQRLAVVNFSTGKLQQISPPDMYVYEYDWSPDGKRFVTTAARGNGDDNWYVAQIYTLEAGGGAMKSIYKPTLQVAKPVWSPDGRSVAFISGLMSDEPSVGGDIFVVPAAGGEARNITPDMKASASSLAWMHDGRSILFGEEVDGESGIAAVDVAGGKIETLWHGPEQLTADGWGTAVSLASDGKTSAVVRASLGRPPEVWAGQLGQWKQITSRNASLTPAWGEAKSIHWSNDGFNLQGWLLYPRNFDPAKKYPMVVSVHGGPGAMVHSTWPGPHSFSVALSAAGYFVFFPNFRGSFGQGETFTRANVKDFGYGDFRDIMAGVDHVLKEVPVDPQRLGITGWSYGGYMTMWAVTQTDRFAAAVAGAGIANFQSYYGQNQIDQWMIPFFGASVYDDPQVYARSSPITFIKQAKTPALVLVGDSDGECPTPQSFEFWHALKTLGVKTELVVYEHEGHSFANPKHQRDVIERAAAWFDAYLK
ncbi:MAG TPA: S9 family peptidase [Candidatus Limnocylindrales bacterium]|nr:S9 family peptidase [Candidatus Limnocylindrales bacterium]